jgi:predicted nucleotidyltransferase
VRFREGDLIRTKEGLIFDVKGLVHPPMAVVAFVRYVPSQEGTRHRDEIAYTKVYSLSERFALLKRDFPKYLIHDSVFDATLSEVPVSDIQDHYQPTEKLEELRHSKGSDSPETKALRLARTLEETAEIQRNAIGISGSILAGLHTSSSDIDPVIYGCENCAKTHSSLKKMLQNGTSPFRPYSLRELKTLFEFRSKDTAVGFEDFVKTESRKALQGKFDETDYFMRYVKDWDEDCEKYGDVLFKNVGYSKIRAVVTDDSESIFTPCKYRVEDAKVVKGTDAGAIAEVASFRGRFCEQARTGESIIAQGKVEQVTDTRTGREHYRLLLGNKPSDHIILA